MKKNGLAEENDIDSDLWRQNAAFGVKEKLCKVEDYITQKWKINKLNRIFFSENLYIYCPLPTLQKANDITKMTSYIDTIFAF